MPRLFVLFLIAVTPQALAARTATFFFEPDDLFDIQDVQADDEFLTDGGMFKLHRVWNQAPALRSWEQSDRAAVEAFFESLSAGEGIGHFDLDLNASANAAAWGQSLPVVTLEAVIAPAGWTTRKEGLNASWTATDPALRLRPRDPARSDDRFGFQISTSSSSGLDAMETIWIGGYNFSGFPMSLAFNEFTGGFASVDARPGTGFEVSLRLSQFILAGDYNANGNVEQADLDLVLLHWGDDATNPPSGWLADLPSGHIDQEELDGVLLHWGDAIPLILAGDYNANGNVEQADLDLVLLHWGDDATNPPSGWVADLPRGPIDQEELDGVLLHWGDSAPLGTAAAVPEPAGLAWLLVVSLVYLARRKNPST